MYTHYRARGSSSKLYEVIPEYGIPVSAVISETANRRVSQFYEHVKYTRDTGRRREEEVGHELEEC